MSALKLALKNIRYRLLSSLLTVASVAVGFALVIAILQARLQTQEYFSESAYGYDLLVGAKGSPLQLVLNTVYQLDKPIENIPISLMDKLKANPGVDYVVPFSLGDNFRGFRLLGTNADFFDKLEFKHKGEKAKFWQGGAFQAKFEAVLGSATARKTGLRPGDRFVAAHGFEEKIIKKGQAEDSEDGEIEEEIGGEEHHHDAHEDNPYVVAGVLKETGTAIDRVVLVDYQSVLTLHGLEHSARQEITSLAVKMKSPMLAFAFRQALNKGNEAQAVFPFQEIQKLFDTIGRANKVLLILGYLVIVMACISILLAVYNSLKERKRSLAILRALGAHRRFLFTLLFLEGFLNCLFGGILGFAAGHMALFLLKNLFITMAGVNISPFVFYIEELWALSAIIGMGILVSLLPGFWAYRTEVGEALASE